MVSKSSPFVSTTEILLKRCNIGGWTEEWGGGGGLHFISIIYPVLVTNYLIFIILEGYHEFGSNGLKMSQKSKTLAIGEGGVIKMLWHNIYYACDIIFLHCFPSHFDGFFVVHVLTKIHHTSHIHMSYHRKSLQTD